MPPRRAPARATNPTSDPKGKGKAPASSTATTTASTSTTPSTAPPTIPPPPARPPPTGESLFIEADDDAPSDDASQPEPPIPIRIPDNGPSPASTDIESDASDTDDDPIVRTYDIHLTTTLAQNLYLLQHPVRGKHMPYSKHLNTCPLSARFKPNSGALELDVPINTARYYDQDKGRRWGEAMRKAALARDARIRGGSGAGLSSTGPRTGAKRRREADMDEEDDGDDEPPRTFEEAKAQGRIMSTQTLSARIQPSSTRYMVGVFRPGPTPNSNPQLHLTPLQGGTLQLRPQFGYVDTAVELEKQLARAARADPADTAPPTARALQASVKSATEDGGLGGGGVGGVAESALQALRREEGEEWRSLEWVDQDDEEAWVMFENMFLAGGEAEEATEPPPAEKDGVEEDGGDGTPPSGEKMDSADIEANPPPPKPKPRGPPILKSAISNLEYLHLLAAPRTEKDT